MPLIDGKYVSPVWVNGGAPALDALELQGITDTVQNTQAALGDYQGPFAKLGLTGDPTIGGSLGVLADIGNLHVWKRTVGSAVDYLVSTNRNAYTDGTSGGTTINYVGVVGDKARVQVVEYVGTGTYGSSNPNVLAFDFDPLLVYISSKNIGQYPEKMFDLIAVKGAQRYIYRDQLAYNEVPQETRGYFGTHTFDGKNLSYYGANVDSQLNISGRAYIAVAIG